MAFYSDGVPTTLRSDPSQFAYIKKVFRGRSPCVGERLFLAGALNRVTRYRASRAAASATYRFYPTTLGAAGVLYKKVQSFIISAAHAAVVRPLRSISDKLRNENEEATEERQ